MGILKEYLGGLKDSRVTVIGVDELHSKLIEELLSTGNRITVRDKRTHDQLGDYGRWLRENGVNLVLGDDYLYDMYENVIFRSPDLMPTKRALREAVTRGAKLTSEMEAFFELCPCKIIGVTGSEGKTMTTGIIAKILKNQGVTVHVGGNCGVPLLCKVDEMTPEDVAVLELSSYHLITMQRSPNIAVITDFKAGNVDIHNTLDEYFQAKQNIYLHQKPSDRVVFNQDCAVTRRFSRSAPSDDVIFFSMQKKVKNGVYLEAETGRGDAYTPEDGPIESAIIVDTTGKRSTEYMQVGDIVLPGAQNIANYLAAIAALRGMVSADAIRKTARTFNV